MGHDYGLIREVAQTHIPSIKIRATVITKVTNSLEDPELCWWFGDHWILKKLSWKKWALEVKPRCWRE